MESFLPSEIARLVLGYLKEDKCLKTWQVFLEECPNLEEYHTLYKRGKIYSTNVNGRSLLNILDEYCVLKSKNGDNESSKQTYHLSEPEFLETMREDIFIESTKNAVDLVCQKYFSSLISKNCNGASNLSQEVILPEQVNNCCCNKENQKSLSTLSAKENSHCCSGHQNDKHNKAFVVSGDVKEDKNSDSHKTPEHNSAQYNLSRAKSDLACNVPKCKGSNSNQLNIPKILSQSSSLSIKEVDSLGSVSSNLCKTSKVLNEDPYISGITSAAKHKNEVNISDTAGRKGKKDVSLNDKTPVCDEGKFMCQSYTKRTEIEKANSVPASKENVVSSTNLMQTDEDVELEIIKEVRKGDSNERTASNVHDSSQNNLFQNSSTSNHNPVITLEADDDSDVICQTAVSAVSKETSPENNSSQIINAANCNASLNVQASVSNSIVINQSSINKEVNLSNNYGQIVNAINVPTNYIVNDAFLNQPVPVNRLPMSSTYVLPSSTVDGSFVNNSSSQFYYVLNSGTSNASTIDKTFLMDPKFQSNMQGPIFPLINSINNNSVATPLNNFTYSMWPVPITPANKVSLTAPSASSCKTPKTSSAASNSSEPVITVSQSITCSKNTEKEPPVSGRRTRSETRRASESSLNISKATKRVSYAEFSEDETEKFELDSSETSKRKKLSKRDSYEKNIQGENNVVPVKESNTVQMSSLSEKKNIDQTLIKNCSTKNYLKSPKKRKKCSLKENNAKPGNDTLTTILAEAKNTKSIHGGKSPSPISAHQLSENINHSELLNENRVLKIVLSDIVKSNQVNNPSCIQNEDDRTLIKPSNKLKTQKQKKSKQSSELINSTNSEQKQKSKDFSNLPIPSEKQNKTKSCNGKSNSKKTSTIDMTSEVLNSIEEARHSAINHTKSCMESNTKPSKVLESKRKPKSVYNSIIHDVIEGSNCFDINSPCKVIQGKKNAKSSTTNDAEKSLTMSSSNETKVTGANQVNQIELDDDENTVLQDLSSLYSEKNSFSVNYDFEKPKDLSGTNLELYSANRETVPSVNSTGNSLNNFHVEKTSNCLVEKQQNLVLDCFSSDQSNVNTNLVTLIPGTCGKQHFNVTPQLNSSFSKNRYTEFSKKNFRNFSPHDLSESNSNFVNTTACIQDDNSNFLCQQSETSVFSVMTSISTNTKILRITEKCNDLKPHSEILGTSSSREKNITNAVLPTASKHNLESHKHGIMSPENSFTCRKNILFSTAQRKVSEVQFNPLSGTTDQINSD